MNDLHDTGDPQNGTHPLDEETPLGGDEVKLDRLVVAAKRSDGAVSNVFRPV